MLRDRIPHLRAHDMPRVLTALHEHRCERCGTDWHCSNPQCDHADTCGRCAVAERVAWLHCYHKGQEN